MQIHPELERKAVLGQRGYLRSELMGHLLVDGHGELGPNPRAGQFSLPPARHWAPKHIRLKEGLFLEWPSHLPRAQQLPWDFYGLKGNLPVIPSAATRPESPQHNKSFKEQSAFILGERSVSRHFQFCISSLPLLSSSWSKRQDGQALSKKNLAA